MSDGHSLPGFKCVFCNEIITSGELDPCALTVTASIEQPRARQKEQTFFCHISCLHAASHPFMHSAFYIAQTQFAAIGDSDEDAHAPMAERTLH
jgi:hypothetical protein